VLKFLDIHQHVSFFVVMIGGNVAPPGIATVAAQNILQWTTASNLWLRVVRTSSRWYLPLSVMVLVNKLRMKFKNAI
jgi:hypothetical protein